MDGNATAMDRGFLSWCLQQPGIPYHKLDRMSPDFLVISPPKTGSSWLAVNLRCHPRLFVPGIKEIKYFSSFFKWLDLGWYLDHFLPAEGQLKGEASPSYAILPVERIRLIRWLFPDVKLIFLMREPIARAWSHARHNYRYREANFASRPRFAGNEFEEPPGGIDAVADEQWCENFIHDWPCASGDYLGQLRRWLSVFPREQMYVGFYESIARAPQQLLRDLFGFLRVDANVDLGRFRLSERVLVGPGGDLRAGPRRFLEQLFHDRTVELAAFLREEFGIQPPPEWQATLASSGEASPTIFLPGAPAAFQRERDDSYLADVLAQEETFPSAYPPLLDGFRGYLVVFHRGRLYGLDNSLRYLDIENTDAGELKRHQDAGNCFVAPSLGEVKQRVEQHVFDRSERRLHVLESRQATLEAELRASREHADQLEGRLEETIKALQTLQGETLRLTPRELAFVNALRKVARYPIRAWRRLRAWFARKPPPPPPLRSCSPHPAAYAARLARDRQASRAP
jgi:hypothetical protein